MGTVTKKELAYRISEKTGLKKVVIKKIIQSFIDEIIDELAAGNRLEFREFGVFEIKTRAARKARNPRTGKRVDVPAKSVVHFKAGRLMKERVQAGEESREAQQAQAATPRPVTPQTALPRPATKDRPAVPNPMPNRDFQSRPREGGAELG
ncbi:MAG: integration host factor subunit beta [Planctomycetes bacterium]|nr:integration host factor subunit beta [Planctomycetota bacterium]